MNVVAGAHVFRGSQLGHSVDQASEANLHHDVGHAERDLHRGGPAAPEGEDLNEEDERIDGPASEEEAGGLAQQ